MDYFAVDDWIVRGPRDLCTHRLKWIVRVCEEARIAEDQPFHEDLGSVCFYEFDFARKTIRAIRRAHLDDVELWGTEMPAVQDWFPFDWLLRDAFHAAYNITS
jgi:hypothetical protein